MIGISVSLYDKFDDLSIAHDIIRHNWEDEYYISVCSNHPDASERINELDLEIDSFQRGAQIPFEDKMEDRHKRTNFLLRVNDTIRTAIKNAFTEDAVDYVLHLHSDAWPLSEQSLKDLIRDMDNRNADVAFKVDTRKFLNNYPPGHIMDQFMIFNVKSCSSNNLFERSILDFPPGIHSHRLIMMECIVTLGWDSLYHYSNRTEETFWDGKPIPSTGRIVRPMVYNPSFDQLHVATEDFPNNLGKSLQSHYLKEYGLTDGNYIKELINNHSASATDLFHNLDVFYNELDRELKWYYGLSTESMGRETPKIKLYTDLPRLEKTKKIVRHNVDNMLRGSYNRVKNMLGGANPNSSIEAGSADLLLHNYYEDILNTEELPDDIS
ncbi:hypothetical protein [Halobellus rubicundus]|uniref:Glycosyltransferase family 1 protein n=1 Tax=Halobellus rubicundus TaxID=2996466 RepID=A0ABD5ME02_9EURY